MNLTYRDCAADALPNITELLDVFKPGDSGFACVCVTTGGLAILTCDLGDVLGLSMGWDQVKFFSSYLTEQHKTLY